MKKYYTFLSLFLISFYSFSQKSKEPAGVFYTWDQNWKPVDDQKKAAYFAHKIQVNDTTWQWDVYNFIGPMIASQYFRDADLTVPHGRQIFYHKSGFVDSTGMAVNGKTDGEWTFFKDSGVAVMKKKYSNGKLLSTEMISTKDSLAKDTASGKDEKESSFPGGKTKWRSYLLKNLTYPDRAYKAKIMGSIYVNFIVNTSGEVEYAEIGKSTEFSLDEEALRLIRNSPKWIPATQKGKLVKSYKRQPIDFRF